MNANAKAVTMAALAIAVTLIIFGLGFDIYENNKFSDCVDGITNFSTKNRCTSANRGGLVVALVGAIAFIGAGAAWFSLRKSASRQVSA